MNLESYDLVVVGAGFYGATIAERVSALGQFKVLVIDKRNHIGGNAYSSFDSETGIEVHNYGPHLFHTSNSKVWEYVNRFTSFTTYQHRVFSSYRGQVYPMPINLGTICQFFGRQFTPDEARELIIQQSAELEGRVPGNLEEKAISLIGRPLYEAFIKGYTTKQWQTDPRELPEEIITRLPVRYNFDTRYFSDRYEGLPVDGYVKIFDRMLSSASIDLKLGLDFFDIKDQLPKGMPIVYSGPIDRYFNYSEGLLGWRTIDFERQTLPVDDFQGTFTINQADVDVPHTRTVEYKHLYPDRSYAKGKTIVVNEFSRSAAKIDEPYYPIDTAADKKSYLRYKARAELQSEVHFGGRLGTYRYWDMHQAIGAALLAADSEILPRVLRYRSSTTVNTTSR
jgi:UDP-galactopyranose mutase